jgi:predicted glutamine amidotransferase
MCRLLAITDGDAKSAELVLGQFEELADCGCVPVGKPKGHKDGWGVAAFAGEKLTVFEKEPADAFRDANYRAVAEKIGALNKTNIVIGHLRKAVFGEAATQNTQPFAKGSFLFAHNGSVMQSEKLPLSPGAKKQVKGETDSERLFYYILQMMAGTKTAHAARRALVNAVRHVKKHLDYTAMNVIFTNGRYVWAVREVNAKNEHVRALKLMNYYTLYDGYDRDSGARIICSEPLKKKSILWKKLNNHMFVEIDTKKDTHHVMAL